MADRDLYTVGWICAIHTELVAALAFLDEEHDPPEELDPNDYNNYKLGKISNHYVAIACLPAGEHGIAAAAGAATNLLRSFPNIRFGLMVGTGGGAPTRYHDIRLGDVVVSSPGDGKGGVFQYDFGKTMQGQAFVETGFLDQPPSLLRAAVTGLRADYELHGHTLTEEVNKAIQKKPRLKKTYSRPQTGDILYKPAYTHISGPWEACEACDDDPANCIPRRPRDENDDDPIIHYGLIASANQHMENAIIRDKLAMEKDILCFEMEAAGLMNHFPCLIIRGICDYADTHRNDKWKGYASMIAAAYARDLIRRLAPDRVQAVKTANEILLNLTGQMSELTYNTDKIASKLDLTKLLIADSAEYGSYADQHADECLEGTRTKILHDIEEWATSISSKCIFWLNGMAGTGKSTICRTISKTFQEKNLLGASFFFKKGEADRGNATRFFSTIASQLQTKIPGMADHLIKVIDFESQISTKSLRKQFEKLILEPISCLKDADSPPSFLVVVVDALDECDNDKDIQVILDLIPQLQASGSIHFRVFITSRPDLPIRLGFKDMEDHDYQDLILHQIPEADIEHDIRFFLEHRLSEIRISRMLPQEWPGEANINTLTAISIPLFIFAATMCRVFEDNNLDPQECLDEYLKYEAEEYQLDAIYIPVLNRISSQYSGTSRRKDQLIQDVREVVSAIILLQDPLPIASLSKLIDITTEAIRFRLNSLHSVLNVPNDETLPIRLLHLSFRDFLLDPETEWKTEIWTDMEETNEKLFIQCLNIMRNGLKRNICNLSNYAIARSDIPDELTHQCIPRELEYSCRYWVRHLTSSQTPTSQLQNVKSFLEKHLLHWMEVMIIQDYFDEFVDGLLELPLLAEDDDDFLELIDDAMRYTETNVIFTNPLQIYVSALIFAPTSSVVKQLFSAELPYSISMPQNVDSSWGAKGLDLRPIGNGVNITRDAKSDACEGSYDPVCLAISPNGMFSAIGFLSYMTILQKTTTGTFEEEVMRDNELGAVRALAFSSDSKSLASCSSSGHLQFWDTTAGTLQSTFDEDVSNVTSLVFTTGGQLLASPSKAWDFLTWDHVTGIQQHLLKECLPENASVTLSSNGVLLASSGYDDRCIDLWNLATRNLQHTLMAHDTLVTDFTFSSDGRLLASGDARGIIRIWDTNSGVQRKQIPQPNCRVVSIAFSTDGQLMASSNQRSNEEGDFLKNDVVIWDCNEFKMIQEIREHSGINYTLQFHPNNKVLACFGREFFLRFSSWDITHVSRNEQRHPSFVVSVSFSLDGRLLASACAAGRIIIWDVTSESIIENLGNGYKGTILVFSPNNSTLAFSSSAAAIELWDINKKSQSSISAFVEHQAISCAAFSPSGQLIAYLVGRKDIKIWDIATKTLTQIMIGTNFIGLMIFLPSNFGLKKEISTQK
ncbi:wd40 protein [Trichoderma guizhouense]|uniref:Wd40 protein n=1 Tax=Trichoderma guizhouense TaxID=1491466 RepID=A0A1T3C559_9HYPO|nr:wd40 protein [Trichoderma guizhouense]